MIDIFILAIPILYILWLNHKTFKSLDHLTEPPVSHVSRRSAYATLVRYS